MALSHNSLQYDQLAEIVPNLYIGSLKLAADCDLLRGNGITAVINVAGNQLKHNGIFVHNIVNISDAPVKKEHNMRMNRMLGRTSAVVDSSIRSGDKILINCYQGINRSALVIGAYLISKRGFTADQVINLIREKNKARSRPALTNDSFRIILRGIEGTTIRTNA